MFDKKRKFSKKRLFNLSKWLVNFISVICLIIVIFNTYSFKYGDYKNIENEYGECLNLFRANREVIDSFIPDDCSYKMEQIYYPAKKFRDTVLLIGTLTPIVFYGSIFLYKYLFPIRDKD